MKTRERVLHALLFEVIALIILTPIAVMATGKESLSMTGLAITLSLMAMIWNYLYNILFDRLVTGHRLERSLRIRLIHGFGFELGMIAVSFPLIMWATQMDFLSVLILDVGAIVFFLLYAIAFNWAYDVIKNKYFLLSTI